MRKYNVHITYDYLSEETGMAVGRITTFEIVNKKSKSGKKSSRLHKRLARIGLKIRELHHFFDTPRHPLVWYSDLSNNVAGRVMRHPTSLGDDRLSINPQEDIGVNTKKDYYLPARKVLEERRCKFCGSEKIIKWGKQSGHQRYMCKDCKHVFDGVQQFPNMRTHYKIIATALDMYFEGLSLWKVSRQLRKIYGVRVSKVTIWNWIQKYTFLVKPFTQSLTPKTREGIWHADETSIYIWGKGGKHTWYWDIIDRDTRFIVGTHLSTSKTVGDARAVFIDAKRQVKGRPQKVICDGLPAYYKGLKKAFGGKTVQHKIEFVQKAGIAKEMPANNNRIERFHGTIKERTKIMRGMQNPLGILDGFTLHYNFIRRHQTLGTTPARVAGIKLPFEDGWADLIQFAIQFKNRPNPIGL